MGPARSRRTAVAFPKRGEIYVVAFDPVVGSEIAKTRPALVIQNDIGNRVSPITIVVALSSQIRTIDKSRLGKRLGKVSVATMGAVDAAIKISLGLVPV